MFFGSMLMQNKDLGYWPSLMDASYRTFYAGGIRHEVGDIGFHAS